MGRVIDLAEFRRRRWSAESAVDRLDLAIGRLDPIVHRRLGRLTPRVERELTAIASAVSSGFASEAAERAERLADLLEHPAAGGA